MKHNFKNLAIWRRSRTLTKEIYDKTKHFPKEEKFGLGLQTRRSAISVPSNIAEGCGRGTDNQLAHYLDIAIGSNCELETQIYLGMDLNYVDQKDGTLLINEIIEVRRMIIGFKNILKV